LFGLAAAEKSVVSACVLVFFWGVFAFIRTVTERPPLVSRAVYRYAELWLFFSMGFMNYYLSIGLACFGLAILWRARRFEWIAAAPFAALALLAHRSVFFGWSATTTYIRVRNEILPAGGSWRCRCQPRARLPRLTGTRSHRPGLLADWDRGPLYFTMARISWYSTETLRRDCCCGIFSGNYLCCSRLLPAEAREFFLETVRIAFELYLVTFAQSAAPRKSAASIYGGWIGCSVQGLRAISANSRSLLSWAPEAKEMHLAGFGVCAVVSLPSSIRIRLLNRLESKRRKVVTGLPPGTRVIVTVRASCGLADFICRAFGRTRLHRALLQLCEL